MESLKEKEMKIGRHTNKDDSHVSNGNDFITTSIMRTVPIWHVSFATITN